MLQAGGSLSGLEADQAHVANFTAVYASRQPQ